MAARSYGSTSARVFDLFDNCGLRGVPVRWWHGDADPFVSLDQARRAAALLPDIELHVRPGESHLGGFAVADEMLATLADLWRQRTES